MSTSVKELHRPWTEEEDRHLAYFGPAVGYDRIAEDDLFRSATTAKQRISWLRKCRPEFVAAIDAQSGKPAPDWSLSKWQRWKTKRDWKRSLTGYEEAAERMRSLFAPPAGGMDGFGWCTDADHVGTRYLPDEAFPPSSGTTGYVARKCRDCCNRQARDWANRNHAKRRDIQRRYLYGITAEERLTLISKQGGQCAICPRRLNELPTSQINVEHCHKTGAIRGVVCTWCNTMIGAHGDDPAILRLAAEYIKSSKGIPWSRSLRSKGSRKRILALRSDCQVCTRPFADLPARDICADHDHGARRVRGVICRSCLVMLTAAQYEPNTLLAGATYLERHEL